MSVVHIARTMQVALRIAEEVGRCRVDLQEDRKEAKKAEKKRKADEKAAAAAAGAAAAGAAAAEVAGQAAAGQGACIHFAVFTAICRW